MKRLVLLFIAATVLMSCNLDTGSSEPVYNAKVAWKTTLATTVSSRTGPLVADGYAYIPGWVRAPGVSNHVSLIKVDLTTEGGAIAWRTAPVQTGWGGVEQTQKINGRIYLFPSKGIINVYNDTDGSLVATVHVGSDPAEREKYGVLSENTGVWDKYIFWGNSRSGAGPTERGLLRFDTSMINFAPADPAAPQIIRPQLIWCKDNGSIIWTNTVTEGGIVYLLGDNRGYDDRSGNAHLAAMNADAGLNDTLWERDIPYISGYGTTNLLLHDERLFVLSATPSCYKKTTGETLYGWDSNVLREWTSISSSSKGITFANNKLYYTNDVFDGIANLPEAPPDAWKAKNIICINADTGRLVWGDLPKGSASLGTNVVVANGKAFVAHHNGLRVYNAANGSLIGTAAQFKNHENLPSILHNGLVIFINCEDRYSDALTAIRVE
jgi:hypothetical protein